MSILEALDKGDLSRARDLILDEIYAEVGDNWSEHSPNYDYKIYQVQKSIVQNLHNDKLLTYFGLETLRDRYFLKTLEGKICEAPQDFFARVAAGLVDTESDSANEDAQNLYDIISTLKFMPATPILANAGTNRGLTISCYLTEVEDSIVGIFDSFKECAVLSKGGGGLGVNFSKVRGLNATINGTGKSTGTIPFMKTLDSSTLAISQGGIRRASAATFLDVTHPDIEEFINIRRPTGGDDNRRCLNLHHGVNITDSFMKAVKDRTTIDLVCPRTGEVTKTIDAHDLWIKILKNRFESGEPYITYIDTVNRYALQSHKERGLQINITNLCCISGDTLVLTDKGHLPIDQLLDAPIHAWNGHEWSTVQPQYTGDKDIYLVTFSDGSVLRCSNNHKFHIQKGYNKGSGKDKLSLEVVETKDLMVGDKLQKHNLPVVYFGVEMLDAYTQGMFSGDGCNYKGKNHIDLYGEKMLLAEHLKGSQIGEYNINQDRIRFRVDSSYVKFEVPLNNSVASRLEWFAGLLDSDGCVTDNKGASSIQVSSINNDFLIDIKYMLSTLGVHAKVVHGQSGGYKSMPDGKGGKKDYLCKPSSRLIISGAGVKQLLNLGLKTNRLVFNNHVINRDAKHFVTVKSVEYTGFREPTYCFNEPKNHTAIFNGVYTGQSEILLPTDSQHTAVCCLGSINLEQIEDDEIERVTVIAVQALDQNLTHFIHDTDGVVGYEKARRSAMKERSIGLGLMGWHGYLMKNEIPFDSPSAIGLAKSIQKRIKESAIIATTWLAIELGDCEYNPGYRNSYMTAIAPTANISIIAGNCTPCIEPIVGNAYLQKTLSGSFIVKNKYLEKLLESLGKNTIAVWTDITVNKGSVQHLDFLTPEQKRLFATAYEIDQRVIIRQAAARQEYLCQSQSLNLFFALDESGNVDGNYLKEVHHMAWASDVKTLYYLRSEKASRINMQEDCQSCQ
jgi:ribonucleoside-diphosphate reductase alpha chain